MSAYQTFLGHFAPRNIRNGDTISVAEKGWLQDFKHPIDFHQVMAERTPYIKIRYPLLACDITVEHHHLFDGKKHSGNFQLLCYWIVP